MRAEYLDEGIDLIRTLWDGGTKYHGRHYHYECERRGPHRGRPAGAGAHSHLGRRRLAETEVNAARASLRRHRAADRDRRTRGIPDDVRDIRAWLAERGREQIDVAIDGETPTGDPPAASAQVTRWADSGATWWLETRWEMPHNSDERMREIRERLAAGPPTP